MRGKVFVQKGERCLGSMKHCHLYLLLLHGVVLYECIPLPQNDGKTTSINEDNVKPGASPVVKNAAVSKIFIIMF